MLDKTADVEYIDAVLVVTSSGNDYSNYYTEILRTEGFNYFDAKDISTVNASVLDNYSAVVLSEMSLTQPQADMFSNWVTAGGDLVAMRPDAKLASLLGLTSAGTTRTNQYMLVDTSSAPGTGIVGQTIQYKGTADGYTLNGARAVATFYSDASTSTTDPAVTYRSVGSNGGSAAAFTYDLAKSVIALHQGNQAWAGQERDGSSPIRSNDLFYGAKTGDAQPDWVDLNKIDIPQADEQQRLLGNIMTLAAKDRKPMPHFWYLPHDLKAAVVLAGDDHGLSNAQGTEHAFNNWLNDVGPDCSIIDWQCVRASGYVYVGSALTNSRAAQYETAGFDIGAHPPDDGGGCNNYTSYSQLNTKLSSALSIFRAKYTNLPAQRTTRYHCYVWSDWDSQPKADYANGIRYDLDYVTYPPAWIGTRAALITGSGMNMRFTNVTGGLIDVYQGVTNFENTVTPASAINTVLDNATGSTGYYGIFGTHYDMSDTFNTTLYSNISTHSNVAMISSQQALSWLDGRNSSTFSNLSGSNGRYGFDITAGEGATGLRAMMPVEDAGGTITNIKLAGNTVSYQAQAVKGVQYAVFDANPGSYTVTYSDYSAGGGTGESGSSSGGQTSNTSSTSSTTKTSKKSSAGTSVFDNTAQVATDQGAAQQEQTGKPSESNSGDKTIVQQSGNTTKGSSSMGKWLGGVMLVVFAGGLVTGLVIRIRRRPKW